MSKFVKDFVTNFNNMLDIVPGQLLCAVGCFGGVLCGGAILSIGFGKEPRDWDLAVPSEYALVAISNALDDVVHGWKVSRSQRKLCVTCPGSKSTDIFVKSVIESYDDDGLVRSELLDHFPFAHQQVALRCHINNNGPNLITTQAFEDFLSSGVTSWTIKNTLSPGRVLTLALKLKAHMERYGFGCKPIVWGDTSYDTVGSLITELEGADVVPVISKAEEYNG